MGCSASRTLVPEPHSIARQKNCYSAEEYRDQARAMFARIHVIPPLQRRRARSVGLPEENGVYWVYWRPDRTGNERHEIGESDTNVASFLQGTERR